MGVVPIFWELICTYLQLGRLVRLLFIKKQRGAGVVSGARRRAEIKNTMGRTIQFGIDDVAHSSAALVIPRAFFLEASQSGTFKR